MLGVLSTLTPFLAFGFVSLGAAQGWGPWHALGPFPYSWDKGAENALPFETLEAFHLNGTGPGLETPVGFDAAPCAWTNLEGGVGTSSALDVGMIEIRIAFPDALRDNSRIFLHRTFEATSEGKFSVLIGSDDGLRLWWNGTLLIDQRVHRSLRIGDGACDFEFQPGTNHLLIELSQAGGGYAFQMTEPRGADGPSIDAAIENGVRWMIDQQWLDGSWEAHSNYRGGHAAYTAYTLLKMGVPASHQVIQKAIHYAQKNRGPFTYTAACEILALSELGKAADKKWMKDRVGDLVDWQESSGQFGYPIHPDGGTRAEPDLSNTLFTALALNAAARHGIKAPVKTWQNIITGTLRNMGRSHEVQLANGDMAEAAGFYYWPGKAVTGSMTTAGLSILNLAERAVGKKLPRKHRTDMEEAREKGIVWIGDNLDHTRNPGGVGHHYFYLYGIERVASLLGLSEIGGRNWYQEGADYLISVQHKDGYWGSDRQTDTLLALLFLKRASLPRSGQRSSLRPRTYASSLAETDVLVRAQGDGRVKMYIAEFKQAALETYAWKGETADGLRVRSVEYLLQRTGEKEPHLIQTVAGHPDAPSGSVRFPCSHQFERNGQWTLTARVHVVPPTRKADVVLHSAPIQLRIDTLFEERSLSYLHHPAENRLPMFVSKVSVSTPLPDERIGSKKEEQKTSPLLDGNYKTAWLANRDDSEPTVIIRLKRKQRGGRLVLTHANPRLRNALDRRASRVALSFDGKKTIEIAMDPHVAIKTEIDLGKSRFQELKISIVETVGPPAGRVGFSEVELLPKR